MKKIAILEDDPELLDELREAIQLENMTVVTASSVTEFDQKITDWDVDVFILDLVLPDGNGLDVARAIRNHSDAGIIITSRKDQEVDKVLGLELGADDYIAKPFGTREFIARVRSVLRRQSISQKHSDSRTLKFGDFEINLESRSIKNINDEIIDITTLEFELMVTLTKNKNRVLSRDQLLDAIHEPNWSGYDRGIDGLIFRLREKFSLNGKSLPNIQTVRGIGYMLST
jgi:two-component system, OmpR family, response regulator